MLDRVISLVQTPRDIVENDIAFVIPSYQRPYVWSDDDVLKLLNDIIHVSGIEREGVRQDSYFIGTVLTAAEADNKSTEAVFQLIDGQQRTTTLMLIAVCLAKLNVSSPMASLATRAGKPRLTFAIRDQVQALLGFWAGLPDCQYPGEQAINDNPYLTRLHGALHVIDQQLRKLSDNDIERNSKLEVLADYLYNNVQWVNNCMPKGTDLNRLFATMNTSGIQLEQADILKSLLLKKITSEKPVYEAMWQACENLGNYFERNVRQLFTASDWKAIQPEQMAVFDSTVFRLVNQNVAGEQKGKTLAELAVVGVNQPQKETATQGKQEDDVVYCRSIISFPLLLMHALRIFLHGHSPVRPDIETRLHADKLIESFNSLTDVDGLIVEAQVKAFIECLWQVRYQFDRWVVKWVQLPDETQEHLTLTSVTFNKKDERLTRSTLAVSEIVMLQSVRYFTGERSAQYWLTPFLGRLMANDINEQKDAEKLLEDIDNSLSLVLIANQATQKVASYELLSGQCSGQGSVDSICGYLESAKGTGFEHYWFQKLEYLLWKGRADARFLNESQLKTYRITSKNSIEHVFPQHEEHGRVINGKDDIDPLHCFGNLVLLSPSENSSYSNQTVLKKKADFDSKLKYDSLKLAHLFSLMSDIDLSLDNIKKHQAVMLGVIRKHYTM